MVNKMRKSTIFVIIIDILVAICFFLFYGPIDSIRNYLITTAMNTTTHQYLAYIFYSDEQIQEALFGSTTNQYVELLQKTLRNHSIPPLLIERILNALPTLIENEQTIVLAKALEKIFQFDPLPTNPSKRAFMLVGTCGCGKTIAVAKMAVKAKITGKKVSVITTDIKRAGAIEQLEAFTKILELNLIKVRKADLLKNTIEEYRPSSDLILIDPSLLNIK